MRPLFVAGCERIAETVFQRVAMVLFDLLEMFSEGTAGREAAFDEFDDEADEKQSADDNEKHEQAIERIGDKIPDDPGGVESVRKWAGFTEVSHEWPPW